MWVQALLPVHKKQSLFHQYGNRSYNSGNFEFQSYDFCIVTIVVIKATVPDPLCLEWILLVGVHERS